MNEQRYPLSWPANWARTRNRESARFGKSATRYDAQVQKTLYVGKKVLTIPQAVDRISKELRCMGIEQDQVIVSTNVPLNLSGVPRGGLSEPADPGAAIYWNHKGRQQCMAIDRYDRVADNLAAIAATLNYLRGIERHGGGVILERAFLGFAQLPAQTGANWREIFEVGPDDHLNADAIETRFRALAKKLHPDKNGSHDKMAELNLAREIALAEIAS